MTKLLKHAVIVLLLAGLMSLYLNRTIVGICSVIVFIGLRFLHEKPQKVIFSPEAQGWLLALEKALENNDIDESIRSYQYLMNIAQSETLLGTNPRPQAIHDQVLYLLKIYKKEYIIKSVKPVNTFTDAHFDVTS